MNSRAVPTALSSGQLFLFQEMATRRTVLHRPRNKNVRRRKPRLHPSLRKAAVAGLVAGFAGSLLFQMLWPHPARAGNPAAAVAQAKAR